MFASITYIFRTVFTLLGKAYLFRTSVSLPLVFKDHVDTHVAFLIYFILSLFIFLYLPWSSLLYFFACFTLCLLFFPVRYFQKKYPTSYRTIITSALSFNFIIQRSAEEFFICIFAQYMNILNLDYLCIFMLALSQIYFWVTKLK